MVVLDVGSGRLPAIAPEERPQGVHYAGLDISEPELRRAPQGSYDEVIVQDIVTPNADLSGRFDLVISFQVLEHVSSLDQAFRNVELYLKPGGRFIAQFSGAFSVFGIVNRLVPRRAGKFALERLLKRQPDTVFPAYYHHCWDSKIRELLAGWQQAEIVPRFGGAKYLQFARPLQLVYLLYENWAERRNHANLASHYLVDAKTG
jgi:SAM-dependent methyltransferase